MAVCSSPKEKGTDCRMFGTVFGQSETEILGLIWAVLGLIFRRILFHVYCLCVIF